MNTPSIRAFLSLVSLLSAVAPTSGQDRSLLAAPGKDRIVLTNSTKAHEGEAVLAAAKARNPELFGEIKEVELVDFHDFAEPPMKHKSGNADRIPGGHARTAWVSSADGMIFWGPYDRLEAGDYFIVYRLRFFDRSATGEAAFLDVAQNAVTASGLRPKAAQVPPGKWHEIALPLIVQKRVDTCAKNCAPDAGWRGFFDRYPGAL